MESEKKPEKKPFVEREWTEDTEGKYDEDGFFVTPNGSFWDQDYVYFNREGFDRHGGRYDENGEYVPGEGWDDNLNCYESEKEQYNNEENELDEGYTEDAMMKELAQFDDDDDLFEGKDLIKEDPNIEKVVKHENEKDEFIDDVIENKKEEKEDNNADDLEEREDDEYEEIEDEEKEDIKDDKNKKNDKNEKNVINIEKEKKVFVVKTKDGDVFTINGNDNKNDVNNDDDNVELNISNLEIDINQMNNEDNCDQNEDEKAMSGVNSNEFAKKYLSSKSNSFIKFNNNLKGRVAAQRSKNPPSYILALCPELLENPDKKNAIKNNYAVTDAITEEMESDTFTPRQTEKFNDYSAAQNTIQNKSINMNDYHIKKLYEWLRPIKVDNYLENFIDGGYHCIELMLLQMESKNPITDAILRDDLGIKKIGHRARIINKLLEEGKKLNNKLKSSMLIVGNGKTEKICECIIF